MRTRDERGSSAMLIIGFAAFLAMTIAMLVDASAAYLQRQGLNTLADGAALHGADTVKVAAINAVRPPGSQDARYALPQESR